MFISLDPFCPQEIVAELEDSLNKLIEKGYTNFVVNNIAHISLLKNKNVNMIAGPYLYTFNRWSASWLENQNVKAFIMPYENSRRNLEATFEPALRERVLVPIFSYPALFRMRFKLPDDYNFTYFNDKEGSGFQVVSYDDGSFVMPEMPYSICDKTEFLSQSGFKKMLIDFSKTKHEIARTMTGGKTETLYGQVEGVPYTAFIKWAMSQGYKVWFTKEPITRAENENE